MVRSKGRSGFRIWSILEIGNQIWKVGLESKSMEVKTDMKECGIIIWGMDKAPTGYILVRRNSEGSTLETTRMTRRMEEEQCSIPIRTGNHHK